MVALHKEPLDLNGVVADAVEQVMPLFQARRLHLALRLPPAPVLLEADRKRLVQVFANILNNAAKYTPVDGHVDVQLDVQPGWFEFQVRDNGMGMTPDLLPHVFDLFAQAERSPDRSQGGLGLGLALVKSLAELHGGSVMAHSEGLGHGSTFVVRLPRDAEANRTAKQPDSIGAIDVPAAPLRLMVVDDNADAADVLCLLLEALGHSACVEHGAKQAIERARAEAPQMLFLDIGLPDMDGYELARRLRAMPETAAAVLVAVTGYGQPGDRDRARQAGFDHHVVKPVTLAGIRRLLAATAGAPSDHNPFFQRNPPPQS